MVEIRIGSKVALEGCNRFNSPETVFLKPIEGVQRILKPGSIDKLDNRFVFDFEGNSFVSNRLPRGRANPYSIVFRER